MAEEARIWIGGLPEQVTEEDVKYEFKKYGRVDHVQVRYNTGKCSFAFIKFADKADAEVAMKETDQAKLFGMPFVKVAWAGPKQGSGGRGGKGGGRSRSPRRRSRSPRRRSPSPRRSPRRRSPSRKPSPRRRSPSPRRRSPTPRRRSPERRSPERPPPRSDSRGRRNSSQDRDRNGSRREPSPRRSPPRSPGQSANGRSRRFCILVENLPSDMTWRELKEIGSGFSKVGAATYAKIVSDRVGEIEYSTIEDMDKAIKELDRRRFSGSGERLKAYEKRS